MATPGSPVQPVTASTLPASDAVPTRRPAAVARVSVEALSPSPSARAGVPSVRAGVGLKAEHCRSIVETLPSMGFFEVHAENYMGDGGPPHRYLTAVREHYPLSLHGVGLSIGADRRSTAIICGG